MQRILLVKTSSLGDVVHNFPVVSDIRRRYPQAIVDWAVEEAYEPMVALHPGVDHVIPVAVRRWRRGLLRSHTWSEIRTLRRQLAQRPYDHVIDTQGLAKSALIASFARGEHVGFSKDTARESVAARFYETTYHVPRSMHAVERNRSLAAMALGYSLDGPPHYGLRPSGAAVAGAEHPYVVLLHGTARPAKQWREESWRALAARLSARELGVVLPHGAASEQERSQRIAQGIDRAVIPERLALDRLAAVIGGARAVIGVDTGLLHLAVALEVPTVAVFTATNPALTGPVGSGRIVVCDGREHAISIDDVDTALSNVIAEPRH